MVTSPLLGLFWCRRPRGRSLALAAASTLTLCAVAAAAPTTVPLPKPRPLPRHGIASAKPAPTNKPTAVAIKPSAAPVQTTQTLAAPAAPHVAPHKPATPLAMSAGGSISQSDGEAVARVIAQVRERKDAAAATQTSAAIEDPVARKLAEWIILRSEDNGASAERYRAFITANPSWPGLNFLRRRGEAARGDRSEAHTSDHQSRL